MEFSEYLQHQEYLAEFVGQEENPSELMNYCFEYDVNGMLERFFAEWTLKRKKRGKNYKAKT